MSASVEVLRGGVVESRHRVSVAVADAEGRLRATAGTPALLVFARSVAKPFQAIPLIESGAADALSLTPGELALCCGSHGGEPRHVEVVLAMLARLGLEESSLACGAHAPMHAASAQALRQAGREPGRVHNNCSGKHAGMLALARHQGWPLAGYEQPEHPVQQRMLEEVARWTGLSADSIPTAVDGCGVETYAVPLERLAHAYARLAGEARRRDGAARRVVRAMVQHPEAVGGTDRLCTELMRVTGGRILVKVGAEGVYCAGIPGAELGVAVKVEDGATRASEPALVAALRALQVLEEDEVAALGRWAEPDLTNTRGDRVGTIRAAIRLEAGKG